MEGALEARREADTMVFDHEALTREIDTWLEIAQGLQALFLIDLDDFRQISSSFGREYADALLDRAAQVIHDTFRSTDLLGRLEGDRFLVLMKTADCVQTVRRKAELLLQALQFSARGREQEREPDTSVGITLFLGGRRRFQELLQEAELALQQASQGERHRYHIYDPGPPDAGNAVGAMAAVQLQTLLDNMDGGVLLVEVAGKIAVTYISPSLYQSFDRDPIGLREPLEHIAHYVLPQELPGLRQALEQAAVSGAPLERSFRVRRNEAVEWRRLRAKRAPELGDGVHRLVVVITDITRQEEAARQLRQSQARYQAAIQQADAMLWEVDIPTRTLVLQGGGWARYGGGEISSFPNAPDSYLAMGTIYDDSQAEFRRLFDDIYAGVEASGCCIHIRDDKGGENWVRMQYQLLREENGDVRCAIGITQTVPNVAAEMHRFEHEVQFEDMVKSILLGCIRVNVTQNLVEQAYLSKDRDYDRFVGEQADCYHQSIRDGFVEPADREDFFRQIDRAQLQAWFSEGENWRLVNYRRRFSDGSSRWMGLCIKLMRHPISGDLYAFGYLRDNQVSRGWELSLGQPLERNTATLSYTRKSMQTLAEHVLAGCPAGTLAVVSVVRLLGLAAVRQTQGDQEAGEVLLTFGRLLRLVTGGDVFQGQLDEEQLVLLRMAPGSAEAHREHMTNVLGLLRRQLRQAHPDVQVDIAGGFAVGRTGRATYAQLLNKAGVACAGAAQMMGESTVAYVETEDPTPGQTPEPAREEQTSLQARYEVLEQRYAALEQRYQQQASLLRISENDALTGLLGKRAFYRYARELLDANPNRRWIIVRFDVNRFKVYNDVRGAAAGDALLRGIADDMRQHRGGSFLSGRLDADHFVVLTADDTAAVRRSVERLTRWKQLDSAQFQLTFSVGIYQVEDPSVEVSLMCDRALLALRSVKGGFETRTAWYTDALRDSLLEEQQLVGDMETALAEEQFVVYFQPQVNYDNGRLIGAEALVRWNHPTRGLLSPGVFIPLFEKNSLISRLDEYVWDRCCRQLRQWMDSLPQAGALCVSVNVSRLDVLDTQLCERLQGLVARYGLSPAALRLEITESAYMDSPQQLMDTVEALRQAGFIVEMDDFGSGYSSLNTLKDVTVDVLKLDMLFLARCADSSRGGSILSSVIRMAHWLRLPIIAEGVETKFQADYLKSLGCMYMQGYYFSRPVPAADFEAMLREGVEGFVDRYQTTNLEGVAAFWDPSAQTALLFNSFVGGAAILEYRPGRLEALRLNDNFCRVIGTTREAFLSLQTDLLGCLLEENRASLCAALEAAIADGKEVYHELWLRLGAGGITRPNIACRMRLLARGADSSILYVSIEDITQRKQLELEMEAEAERTRLLMQSTGIALFEYDINGDTFTFRVNQAGRGITRRSIPNYYQQLRTSRIVDRDSAEAIRGIIENAVRPPVSGEVEYRSDLWNSGLRWCLARYVGVADDQGRICRIVGQIDDIQDMKDRAAIAQALRGSRPEGSAASFAYNEEVANQMVSLLYDAVDLAGALQTTLGLLGTFYDLSRAYIFEDNADHTRASNTFEWCAPGITAQKDDLQELRYDSIGGRDAFLAKFDCSGLYHCPDVSTLSQAERATLEPQGIRSMLFYAIRDNGTFTGYIGFDECRENRRWTQEQVGTLMFVSRIVAAYLLKLRQSQRAAFSADLQKALDDNAFCMHIIDPDSYEILYTNNMFQEAHAEDLVGRTCYREFIGRDSPCDQCPAAHLHAEGSLRVSRVVRKDGVTLLSHASPLRWNGREVAILSCVDVSRLPGR